MGSQELDMTEHKHNHKVHFQPWCEDMCPEVHSLEISALVSIISLQFASRVFRILTVYPTYLIGHLAYKRERCLVFGDYQEKD